MLRIMGKSVATVDQMCLYIKRVNPSVPQSVLDMIPFYLTEGKAEGVRGDIAFAQSCLETGNFTFEGSAVALEQNNFAGIGVTQNGMKGNSWKIPQLGIRAQIQHLKAYASDDPLTGACVDPRFKYVRRNCAEYVEHLGIQENPMHCGWAAGKDYGKKIIQILNSILSESGKAEDPQKGDKTMKYFICVGHAAYGGGVYSSADGRRQGGCNEYLYNKELAPAICKWLEKAGHKAVLCVAPEGKLHSLNEEINYFIGEEHKDNYDLSVQLHLNAFDGNAQGCEVFAYNTEGLKIADRICKKLATVWKDRGAIIRTGLYWTRKTKNKAVLIESFFCDSKSDYQKAQKLGIDAHAKLIAEGIIGKSISGNAGKPSGKPAAPAKPIGKAKYIVQSGAFSDKKNADALVKKLKTKGFDAIIKEV